MAEISVNIDENNKVIASFMDGVSGSIKLNIDESMFKSIFDDCTPYKYENGELIVDTAKQEYESLENQVLDLEQNLRETNDKVAEALEYKLRDESIPADLQQILDNRESWRNEISLLKDQMDSLL